MNSKIQVGLLDARSVECGKYSCIPKGNSAEPNAGRIVNRIRDRCH